MTEHSYPLLIGALFMRFIAALVVASITGEFVAVAAVTIFAILLEGIFGSVYGRYYLSD